MRAVSRGDEAAFTRLYDPVAPRVFGLARRVRRAAEPEGGSPQPATQPAAQPAAQPATIQL